MKSIFLQRLTNNQKKTQQKIDCIINVRQFCFYQLSKMVLEKKEIKQGGSLTAVIWS